MNAQLTALLITGSVCLCQAASVCATVSASISGNPYPATDCAAAADISGVSGRWQLSRKIDPRCRGPRLTGSVRRVSRYQFTDV